MTSLSYTDIKYFINIHPESSKLYKEGSMTQDIPGRCDICGDSKKNKNKKRLHLYQKNGMKIPCVKCFNCNYSSSFKNYIRTYHPGLYNNYISDKGLSYFINNDTDEIEKENIEFSGKMDIYTGILNDNNLNKLFLGANETTDVQTIQPFNKNVNAIKYFINRKINPNHFGLEVYFSTDDYYIEEIDKTLYIKNSIIIPLKRENLYYGFYSRKIDAKLFYTYISEGNNGFKIWNIDSFLTADKIYVFEAIFDALSSGLDKNEISAALGASISPELLKMRGDNDIIFVFDNDEAGYAQALKYVTDYYVVNWPSTWKYKDCNEALLDGVSREEISNIIKSNIVHGFGGEMALRSVELDKKIRKGII